MKLSLRNADRREIGNSLATGGLYGAMIASAAAVSIVGADGMLAKALPALSQSVFEERLPQFAPRNLSAEHRSNAAAMAEFEMSALDTERAR